MPHYLLVKNRLKGFRKAGHQTYRAVVRRIGAVTLFRDRMYVQLWPKVFTYPPVPPTSGCTASHSGVMVLGWGWGVKEERLRKENEVVVT